MRQWMLYPGNLPKFPILTAFCAHCEFFPFKSLLRCLERMDIKVCPEAVVLCWASLSLQSCYGVTPHTLKWILHRTIAWKATSTPDTQHKTASESPAYPPCNLALVSSSILNSSNQLSWQQWTGPTSVTCWRDISSCLPEKKKSSTNRFIYCFPLAKKITKACCCQWEFSQGSLGFRSIVYIQYQATRFYVICPVRLVPT